MTAPRPWSVEQVTSDTYRVIDAAGMPVTVPLGFVDAHGIVLAVAEFHSRLAAVEVPS